MCTGAAWFCSRWTTITCSIDGVPCQRLVRHLLERDDLAAAPAAVRGDEEFALRIVDAIAKRFGAEAAEHHRMDGANARAREHRDGQLGYERQIQRDAIAFLDAKGLEDVRELADLAVEIEIGQRAPVAGLAFPDEGRLVAAPRAHVPIEAVRGDVDLAVGEPLRIGRVPLEHLRERLDPLELAREAGPERFGIFRRSCINTGIVDEGLGAELFRWSEAAVFFQEGFNFGRHRLGHEPEYMIS